MVIDGIADVVGCENVEVKRTIAKAWLSIHNTLPLSPMARGQEHATIKIGERSEMPSAYLWLIEFDKERTVDVRQDENTGRQLIYHKVVRNIRKVG